MNFDEEKNKILGGTLYLVTTPIGNMSDITYRAVKTLAEVDFIAAEDTRNTARLLSHFEIKKPLVSYHEHNKATRGPEIVNRLKGGQSCALVTDAGTPAISDPGEDLVCLCVRENIPVTAAPGVSAVVTALSLSALPARRFVFEGFLSTIKSERRARLEALKNETRTIIIYEAPHKLKTTLDDLLVAFGDREISLCRELTKRNEEILRTTLKAAVSYYNDNEPRGEYVLILAGGAENEDGFWQDMDIPAHVNYYISLGLSKNDAIKAAAKDRGVPKNVIYNTFVK